MKLDTALLRKAADEIEGYRLQEANFRNHLDGLLKSHDNLYRAVYGADADPKEDVPADNARHLLGYQRTTRTLLPVDTRKVPLPTTVTSPALQVALAENRSLAARHAKLRKLLVDVRDEGVEAMERFIAVLDGE